MKPHNQLWKKNGALQKTALLILPLILITLIRVIGFSSENSVDCYYHVYMADAGPSIYTVREFPQLTMSVWNMNFSDKELGFHLILSTVRRVKKFLGISLTPPFNTEALIFSFSVILAFIILLRYFNVEGIGYYTLLLITVSPFFTNRLLMLRPHNLSITLMLSALPVLFSIRNYKTLWRAFLLGMVTAWCYSNPHFILLPGVAVCVAMILKKNSSKVAISAFFTLLGGLILGYIIHPQFPNTFINWKIQSVDVVLQALFHNHNIPIGSEFHSPSITWFLKNSLPAILFFISMFLVFRIGNSCKIYKKEGLLMDFFRIMKNSVREVPAAVIATGIIAGITLLALSFGVRVMEYAAPFSVAFSALVIDGACKHEEEVVPFLFRGKNIARYIKILIIVTAIASTVFQIDRYKHLKGFKPLNDFAKWTEHSDIPDNAIIANLIWSDFSFLIYSVPRYRYICGQDPMFSYAIAPEKIEKLEQVRRSQIKITPAELTELTGARYAFIRKPYKHYAATLIRSGFIPIYKGKDGWLFEY